MRGFVQHTTLRHSLRRVGRHTEGNQGKIPRSLSFRDQVTACRSSPRRLLSPHRTLTEVIPQSPAQPRRGGRGEEHPHDGGGDDESVNFAEGALRIRVEGADLVDLVAKEVDAVGGVGIERVDIDQSAAHSELPRSLTQDFGIVAQVFREFFCKFPKTTTTEPSGNIGII